MTFENLGFEPTTTFYQSQTLKIVTFNIKFHTHTSTCQRSYYHLDVVQNLKFQGEKVSTSFLKKFRSFNATNLESLDQTTLKLPAVKVVGLEKKSVAWPQPQHSGLEGHTIDFLFFEFLCLRHRFRAYEESFLSFQLHKTDFRA